MNLRDLEAFTMAAELGSLSRAALALETTQSALSRQLASLEAELAGRLFHRTGRGVALTELGESSLARAQALLRDAKSLVENAHDFRGAPRGVVTVGVVPAISWCLVGHMYRKVLACYPEIRIVILEGYSGEVEEWLGNGRIDIGVLNHYSASVRGLDVLLTADMRLIVAMGSPLATKRSIKFASVAEVPLALPTRPSKARTIWDEAAHRLGKTLNVQLEVSSPGALMSAVVHGGLATLMPYHAVAREHQNGKIAAIPVRNPTLRQSLILESTHHRPLSAAARAVLQLMPQFVSSALDADLAGSAEPLLAQHPVL